MELIQFKLLLIDTFNYRIVPLMVKNCQKFFTKDAMFSNRLGSLMEELNKVKRSC
jgi:hypothetical protein